MSQYNHSHEIDTTHLVRIHKTLQNNNHNKYNIHR